MATSQMAVARLKLQTLARTVLANDRVALGIVDLKPSDEFFTSMTTADPFFLILPGKYANWDPQQRTRDIIVSAKLWYAIPADQDFDGTTVEDVNENLLDTFTDYHNWIGSVPGPQPSAISGPEYNEPDMEVKPGVGFYLWEFVFQGSARA